MKPWRRFTQYRPAPPVPVRIVDTPPNCPEDIEELALLAAIDGPELLAGRDPAAVGLLVIHPHSPACPMSAALLGHAALRAAPLADIETLAAELHAPIVRRPGWFCALLVGVRRAASTRLAPAAWRKGAA